MTLKQRIDDHLEQLDWVNLVGFTDPNLRSLLAGRGDDYRPIVATRYTGQTIFAGFRRPSVDVVLIVAQTRASLHADGQALETTEDRLIAALNQVDDCYPELLPTEVDYAFRLAGGPRRGGGGEATYIALIIPTLGA